MMHQNSVKSRPIKLSLTTQVAGSPSLYVAVRAGFVNQGSSLNRWCRDNAVNRQTAEKALKGERHSRRAQQLIETLISASLGFQAVK
ncbi:hypothetical protein [Fulvimarina sp. MAC3]|uniref:hypothetical protein n=1 Tax=Fulvimarina sp. MAC3 TaxID=3148887 RepID=UPI0031FC2F00